MLKVLYRTAAVAALACAPLTASALGTPVTYDFKAAAESSGALGESAFGGSNIFDTSLLGVLGPVLKVTATKLTAAAFVYFDAGNAGMGVCGALMTGSTTGARPGLVSNICNPSNDDGITTITEVLTFTALSDMFIRSVDVNSNHDGGGILGTKWEINGSSYDLSSGYTKASDGDVTIALGDFFLAKDSSFTIHLSEAPNSYLSSMTVAAVPLPAAAWLLLGVAGALVAAKRRSEHRSA